MKKLAVLFPGIGYHVDKPLLYYGAKLAKQYDFLKIYRVQRKKYKKQFGEVLFLQKIVLRKLGLKNMMKLYLFQRVLVLL